MANTNPAIPVITLNISSLAMLTERDYQYRSIKQDPTIGCLQNPL